MNRLPCGSIEHGLICTLQAFEELAKGERTATALENQLSKMEARIQALLDQAENEQKEVAEMKSSKASSSKSTEQSEGQDGHDEGKNS